MFKPENHYYRPWNSSEINGWNYPNLDLAEDFESAIKLLCLMEDISQHVYLASWLHDLEFVLWEQIIGEAEIHDFLHPEAIKLLINLSQKSGGWWYWKERNLVFILKDNWQQRYGENQS